MVPEKKTQYRDLRFSELALLQMPPRFAARERRMKLRGPVSPKGLRPPPLGPLALRLWNLRRPEAGRERRLGRGRTLRSALAGSGWQECEQRRRADGLRECYCCFFSPHGRQSPAASSVTPLLVGGCLTSSAKVRPRSEPARLPTETRSAQRL